MANKVLTLLLASHFVSAVLAADITSLIAPNYAQVSRTGSFSDQAIVGQSFTSTNDERHPPEPEVTTEASDFYNVYYPVMEAETVTESNGNQSASDRAHGTLPVTTTSQINSESPVSVLQFNPLASFINAFFRQSAYVTKNDENDYEEEYESSPAQQSAPLVPKMYQSSQPDTHEIPSALNNPVYSYAPSSYDFNSSRVYVSGRSMNLSSTVSPGLLLGKNYTQLQDEDSETLDEQNVYYTNSQKHPPDDTEFTLLNDSNHPPTSENPYKLINGPYQLPPSEDEAEPQEVPKYKHSYNYEHFKDKISPEEDPKNMYNYDEEHVNSYPLNTSSSEDKNQPARVTKPVTQVVESGREKNPYTYFYVGRKLWYIPLFFSVYFMVYVLALVVKSISRHKIVFPVVQWKKDKRDVNPRLEDITYQVTTGFETTERLYL